MLPDYALIDAAKSGVTRDFEDAIARGADVNARDFDRRSVLEIAGAGGRGDFIKQLVQKGADRNQPIGTRGDVLLHQAARTGNFGFATSLLELGAEPSPVNTAGKTPLHLATMKGFQYVADALMAHGASANEATPQGDQPLHIAARLGDVPMIRALLKAGADIDATNNTGYTPLHEAAASGKTEVVELLLQEPGISGHRRSVLLPRVRRAAELHGQTETAALILAAEQSSNDSFAFNVAESRTKHNSSKAHSR